MDKSFALTALLVLLNICATKAQEAVSDTTEEVEVVVTATRTPAKIFNSPYSVSIVAEKEIANSGSRSVPESLFGTTGIFVQKTNHGGGSAFLRGLTGNQTLILIDGVRLNNAIFRYGPNQYLNTIDPYSVKKIEMLKGAGSVQYGSDAMGGVIHVFTAEPGLSVSPHWSGKVGGRIVSNNMEQSANGRINFSAERFGITTGITKRHFNDLKGGDTTGIQRPSGYDEWAFDVKSICSFNNNFRIRLAHQYLQQNDVPIYHKIVLENYKTNHILLQNRSLSYIKLEKENDLNLIQQISITASYQSFNEKRALQKNTSNILRKENDAVKTVGFTTDISSRFNDHYTANTGVEFYSDEVGSHAQITQPPMENFEIKRGLYPDESVAENLSAYTLHHFQRGNWIAEGGLRYSSSGLKIKDSALGLVKLHPAALVGNVAVMYRAHPAYTVYTAYSTGFRAPNIDDLGTLGIVDFRFEVPAFGLKAERSKHIEMGIKHSSRHVQAQAALYYMPLKQLITRIKTPDVVNNYPVYIKENNEAAMIKGGEINWHTKILKLLSVNGGVAYTYGQNSTKDEPMRRIPPMHGNLKIILAPEEKTEILTSWNAGVEWLFAGRQLRLAKGDIEDNRIGKTGTPGWSVLNLYGAYQCKLFMLRSGINNLFNQDYRLHGSGINGQGRCIWLSLQMTIK